MFVGCGLYHCKEVDYSEKLNKYEWTKAIEESTLEELYELNRSRKMLVFLGDKLLNM